MLLVDFFPHPKSASIEVIAVIDTDNTTVNSIPISYAFNIVMAEETRIINILINLAFFRVLTNFPFISFEAFSTYSYKILALLGIVSIIIFPFVNLIYS